MLDMEAKVGLAGREIIILSGRVGTGKTSFANALELYDFHRLSTRSLLLELVSEGLGASRSDLQRLGARLDRERGGRWVADALARVPPQVRRVVVDAIRTVDQRAAIEQLSPVLHCHVWAPAEVLDRRYELRQREEPQFESHLNNPMNESETEERVDQLGAIADVVFNSEHFTPQQMAGAAARLLERH